MLRRVGVLPHPCMGLLERPRDINTSALISGYTTTFVSDVLPLILRGTSSRILNSTIMASMRCQISQNQRKVFVQPDQVFDAERQAHFDAQKKQADVMTQVSSIPWHGCQDCSYAREEEEGQ